MAWRRRPWCRRVRRLGGIGLLLCMVVTFLLFLFSFSSFVFRCGFGMGFSFRISLGYDGRDVFK